MKVAVAGLGWWGKQIIRCLSRSAKFDVLYGVDPTPPEGVEDFAREFSIKLERDFAAVLSDPAVEGVILATPHSLHEEQILGVVAAGKNVFCEKPLTMTAAGAERVIEACRKADKVLGIGHERRFEPGFEEMIRLVQEGSLGQILYLDANVSHDQFRKLDHSNWRLNTTHAPAGMMTAVGIHLTDLFVLLAGAPAEVSAQTASMIFVPPAEDFVTARIRFRSGARAALTALSATPFYARFTVYGDLGWVEVASEANIDRGKPTTLIHCDATGRRTVVYEATDTVTENFEAWADAVAGRTSYRFSNGQLLDNIRLFESIVRSSRQGGATISL
jgi:predicted dehydrogenase